MAPTPRAAIRGAWTTAGSRASPRPTGRSSTDSSSACSATRSRPGTPLQTTFARAVERGHDADPASIRAWLFRVAAREAINERRRGARRHRLERGFAWLREAAGRPDSEGVDHLVRLEEIEGVRAALEELPTDYLAVVRARIFEDKTFSQIAAEQQIPLGTAISRMRRALERLARRLRDEAGR